MPNPNNMAVEDINSSSDTYLDSSWSNHTAFNDSGLSVVDVSPYLKSQSLSANEMTRRPLGLTR
jgi:hypothetical protein